MKTYKGFTPELKCRDFQYEVGKTYEHNGPVKSCESGFHACENPMDVFTYYPPATEKGVTRYCETESDGKIDCSNSDKVCSSRLHIHAEIGLRGLIEAGVKFILDKVKWNEDKESNTGTCSAATNTGTCSAATNTGDWSAATNTGTCSAATNTGGWSAATNTGDRSAATNTGNWSAATNTGNRSAATNTGNRSAATVEGQESIAIVTGKDSRAKGTLGNWLVLTERDEQGHILEVKTVKVDNDNIKPDTWYWLKDGEIIEWEE